MASHYADLSSYFSEQHRKVLVGVTNTLDDPSHDKFHALRVTLKRIRFAAGVLKRYGKSSKKEHLAPYSILIRYAGQIRKTQVNTRLLEKYGVAPKDKTYTKNLRRKQEKLLREWPKVAISSLQEIVAVYPKLKKQMGQCTVSDADYLSDLESLLKNCFADDLKEHQLHSGRKILKTVVYSCELSPELKEQLSDLCNLKVITSLDAAIGDWHDLVLLAKQHKLVGESFLAEILPQEMHKELLRINRLVSRLLNVSRVH